MSSPEVEDTLLHQRLRSTRLAKRSRLFRARLERFPRLRRAYKIALGVVGVVVVIAGIILIPLPGPGWLVVFVGLTILGTEFPAAHRLRLWAQRKLRAAAAWANERRKRRRTATR